MKKIIQLNLKIKIIISIVIVCLFIGSGYGIYLLTKSQAIEFEAKDDKNIIIEYGQNYEITFDNLVKTKGLKKDKIKELRKKTKITSTLANEEGKDYPAIGEYEITVQYDQQKFTKKVKVQDTIPPAFNDVDTVSIALGDHDFDFNTQIQASDLSPVNISYDVSSLDSDQTGEYIVKATARDSSGNETAKDIQVTVKQSVQGLSGVVYEGNGAVICIDAGHQRYGNSAKEPNGPGSSTYKAKVTTGATGVSTGTAESEINLQVATKLQKILTSRGYKVIMCRTSQDVDISNAQRAEIANNANAAAFIRLHCDSSESSSVSGTMTMAPSKNNPYCSSISGSSQKLANAVLNHTCQTTGSKNRGVSITDTMTGLNWSKVPVTIIEMGFLSNPSEDRLLNDSSYQDKLATGIADGIGEFLK